MQKNQKLKVQVGCGPHNILKSWVNVDIRDFPGINKVMDVTKEWPFLNVDFIYGEHFIEHLPVDGMLQFLLNAGRSLNNGGVIRLTTPNLTWVMKSHYRFDSSFNDLERVQHTLSTNRAFHGWGHHFLYDMPTLEFVLKELGFVNITFCNYSESKHDELRNIERHGGFAIGAGEPNTLFVEATKQKHISLSKALIFKMNDEFIRYVNSGH